MQICSAIGIQFFKCGGETMSQSATIDNTAASSSGSGNNTNSVTTANNVAPAISAAGGAALFPPTIILGGQAITNTNANTNNTGAAAASTTDEKKSSSRLEGLTVSPMDGTLICSPLSAIVNAVTEGLYDELKARSETLQSLSFAQRHFELSQCMAQHLKRVAHITALTEYTTSPNNHWETILESVQQTLRHVRVSWGAADEAQDALFFHHADLWKARSHCHDLYGALQTFLNGQWTDLSKDLHLQQPYPTTNNNNNNNNKKKNPSQECLAKVQSLVRTKLVHELSYKDDDTSIIWKRKATSWEKIQLEQDQIVVKCVFGPKFQKKHAMEVRLTVLSSVWTLLELHIQVQAKTGESHQSCHVQNTQMFTLHKLCTKALQLKPSQQSSSLETLFQLCHDFLQSWQFQLLYSQAYSLSKSKTNTLPTLTVIQHIAKTNDNNQDDSDDDNDKYLNELILYFWSPMEERFASLWKPSIGPLDSTLSSSHINKKTSNKNDDEDGMMDASRYCLHLVGIPNKGIQVYLTGAAYYSLTEYYSKDDVTNVLQHIQNSQQVSISHAILAATVICAKQKCQALVQYYNSSKHNNIPWMKVSADGGTIVVSYQPQNSIKKTVLFRVEVDSKTGNFIVTFPKSYTILYSLLPTNNTAAATTTKTANKQQQQQQQQQQHQRGLTKRFIKEAVHGLVRSMEVLSKRVGVGVSNTTSKNKDDVEVMLLRERAMDSASVDVQKSLMICSAIAYTYGIGAIALSIASSVQVQPDM